MGSYPSEIVPDLPELSFLDPAIWGTRYKKFSTFFAVLSIDDNLLGEAVEQQFKYLLVQMLKKMFFVLTTTFTKIKT